MIAEELQRIVEAKTSIRASIIEKGVDVPDNAKLDSYYTYIKQISGGGPAPSTSAQVNFSGATIPLTWTNATLEDRTYVYKSDNYNITINGDIRNVATISGNGSKEVTVIVDEGSFATDRYDFTICLNSGDKIVEYNGMLVNANKELSDGECLTLFKTPDGYDVLSGTDVPYFTSRSAYITANGTRYYSHQVVSFSFARSLVTSINANFMGYCSSFNQPLTIPSSVTSIGNYFMGYCSSFNQPLTIPSSVTSIGNCFLYQCYSFNQPLTIPSSVTKINIYFLYQCYSFNQPLTIPSSVTSIGSYFMGNCYSFNQPLTIPSSVKSINAYFMGNCYSFNQPVTIPSSNTSIDYYFLSNCYSFNQTLTIPSSVTSIGGYFLSNCYSFNQPVTIPSSVTSIGNYFLYQCSSFNQPLTIPSSVTNIGGDFLSNCYSFNQTLTIPSSVTSIGNYFMYQCHSFSQPLTIPSSVTSIGVTFMNNCYSFFLIVYNASALPTSSTSLAQDFDTKTSAYGTGIKVTGDGADGLLAALPNSTSNPFRKLYKG